MLPCVLCCLLSYLSYTHLSTLGWPPSSYFPWYVHIQHSSHYVLLFHSPQRPYHFSRFSVIFLGAWTTLVVPPMCSLEAQQEARIFFHTTTMFVVSFHPSLGQKAQDSSSRPVPASLTPHNQSPCMHIVIGLHQHSILASNNACWRMLCLMALPK